jgi:CMP-N,N'-diacetyllegionaminic acid synthase
MIFSLIPARGGSKGIPRKNVKPLLGKPLIAYTIEASLKSKLIKRTIVSTDDIEIKKISEEHGANVPYIRPQELSGDDILDYPVIEHCLNYLINSEKIEPKIIVYLRPTMPLRESQELDIAIEMLLKNNSADSIRTVRPAPYPPFWMKRINNEGYLEPYNESVKPYEYMRRQDLPPVVICDGYVDAARVDSVVSYKVFPVGNIISYFRKNIPFFDIDTDEDWKLCEAYFRQKIL